MLICTFLKVSSNFVNSKFTGAVHALGDFVRTADDRTQFAVLCAIRNLSDAATNEDTLGPLIVNLIDVVAAGEESTTACAAGVLSNLTCNNIRNKQTLCTNRYVFFLVQYKCCTWAEVRCQVQLSLQLCLQQNSFYLSESIALLT